MPKTPDVNCNDTIRIEIKVNGMLYQVIEKLCNTSAEMILFRNKAARIILNLELAELSRFIPVGGKN